MTPREAKVCLEVLKQFPSMQAGKELTQRALETIAGMTKETRPVIVNPDTNGGKYETKTQTRYITEWEE